MKHRYRRHPLTFALFKARIRVLKRYGIREFSERYRVKMLARMLKDVGSQ